MSETAVSIREYMESQIAALRMLADDRRDADQQLRAADELRYQQLREKEQTALTAALSAAKEAVQTALLAAKEAVVKAEMATERRLEGLNELRQGVATRDQLEALLVRVDDVKTRVDRIEASRIARAGGLQDYVGWIVALVTVVSAFVGFALLFRH